MLLALSRENDFKFKRTFQFLLNYPTACFKYCLSTLSTTLQLETSFLFSFFFLFLPEDLSVRLSSTFPFTNQINYKIFRKKMLCFPLNFFSVYVVGGFQGEKRASDSLELELKVAVSSPM